MPTIHVELGANSYPIIVDRNVLGRIGDLLKVRAKSSKAMVIADAFVSWRYGTTVFESLSANGFESSLVEVPPGEEQKSMAWFTKLHDALIDAKLDRNSTVVALGGGVVGDLAGFVAATYMRGIPFVQVPTTLLSQVDASVGGKTAIDHPKGKNLIGAFHQPKLVLIDVETLRTLPLREIRAGLVEVIKAGVIMDLPLFAQIEENLYPLLRSDSRTLIDVICRACEDKVHVVMRDEKESGLRETLNYGHTFGHALEALTDYNTYKHGEAVAIGMNCAARLAVNLGMLSGADYERQKALLVRTGLPIALPASIAPRMLIEAMYLDKKTRDAHLRLVLPTRIGEVVVRGDVPEAKVAEAIAQCRE